jgi:hypothetical protein
LDKYRSSKNFSDLENAMHMDNTNQDIIFQYLSNLKSNNLEKYKIEVEKYKFFLEEKFCKELEIKYIDHKKDLLCIIDSFRMVDSKNILDFQPVKNALEKCYSRKDKQLLGSKSKERINNLPLFDIWNDVILYLTQKIEFGDLLYLLVDYRFNDDEGDNKDDKKNNNNECNQNVMNKDEENQNVLIEEKDKNSVNKDNENGSNKKKDNIVNELKDNQIVVNQGKVNKAMNMQNINDKKENNENEELEDEEIEDEESQDAKIKIIVDVKTQKKIFNKFRNFFENLFRNNKILS